MNFPFGTNGKLIILGAPIRKHIRVILFLFKDEDKKTGRAWWRPVDCGLKSHRSHTFSCFHECVYMCVCVDQFGYHNEDEK